MDENLKSPLSALPSESSTENSSETFREDAHVIFGPYTPQETDRIATALQASAIPFEIHKDTEDEKKFTRSDFQSIVTRAEYRTESYLAQIFYFSVELKHEAFFKSQLKKWGVAPTDIGEEPANMIADLPDTEQRAISADAASKRQQKRLAAQLLVAFIVAGILYGVFARH